MTTSPIQDLLLQAGYYLIVLAIGMFLISMLQKGFFMPFLKVRASFGNKIMVKIRAVNRDYFRVGWIEDAFLVFKSSDGEKRINVPDSSVFYRVMGTTWCDVDEVKNALVKPDFTVAPGFDAVKYNDLYIRALYRPSVSDNTDKLMIGLISLAIVLIVICGFLVYKNGYAIEYIKEVINNISKGIIVGAGKV